MKYGVMLAAGSLLLAGCSSVEPEPSPELKRLSEEIATLKQSLQKMDGKLDKLLVKPKARSDGFVECWRRSNRCRINRPMPRYGHMWGRFWRRQKIRIRSSRRIRRWRCSKKSVRGI